MLSKVFIDGLSFAMPLFIMAVGGIYSERSGVATLALEGFQGFGAFVGAFAAVLLMPVLGESSQSVIYLAMIAAFFGGAVFSMIHALLCIRFHANQIISGVVVNLISTALTTFLTSLINSLLYGEASNKFMLGTFDRFDVPILSDIPVLGWLFQDMYSFEWFIPVIAIILWYIMEHTRFGLRLRACGENPDAVTAAGGNVNRTRYIAVFISGGLSGIGGLCYAYSITANFSSSIYMGYGFLAIAAMIFGKHRISSTAVACLIFGFAKAGGSQLCVAAGLSSNYSDLFLMTPYILTIVLLVIFSLKNPTKDY